MSNIQAVTDAEFESVVLKSEIPVLVDFWATWCGPCRMIAPIVEQIQGELGTKVKVMKMDIDENPATPMSLGIMSIPTVIHLQGRQACGAERWLQAEHEGRPDREARGPARLARSSER